MRKIKILRALAAVLLTAMLLSGCSLFETKFDAATYVKGTIDAQYSGIASKAYLDILSEGTAESVKAIYEDRIVAEAEYFYALYYLEQEHIPASFMTEVIELYREIYAKAKYEVGAATKSGDNYLVSVTIHPIDIIQKLDEDFDDYLEEFFEDEDAIEDMSEEEFETLWARGFIDIAKARLATLGYLEPETISVQVNVESKSKTEILYSISDNDIERIDGLVIKY